MKHSCFAAEVCARHIFLNREKEKPADRIFERVIIAIKMVRLAALVALLSTASATGVRRQLARNHGKNSSPNAMIHTISERSLHSQVYRGMSTAQPAPALAENRKTFSKQVSKGQRTQLHRAMSKLGQGSRGVNWKKIKAGLVNIFLFPCSRYV
jgi:hypothetical protein